MKHYIFRFVFRKTSKNKFELVFGFGSSQVKFLAPTGAQEM